MTDNEEIRLNLKETFIYLKKALSLKDFDGNWEWEERNKSLYRLELPLVWKNLTLEELAIKKNLHGALNYVVVLVQSGSAMLAVFKNNRLLLHKRIQKYMVRKKRGKSQLTYLKKKGKSRAGSRIRLRESEEFFLEINHTLEDWMFFLEKSNRIYLAYPLAMGSFLFAKGNSLSGKQDKIVKLPLTVRTPCMKELGRVYYEITRGRLFIQGPQDSILP